MSSPNIDLNTCADCGGFCCHNQIRRVEEREMDGKNYEFWSARAYDIKKVDGLYYFVINMKCSKITDEGCSLGEGRPQICKEFPPHFDPDWWHFCPLMRQLYKPRKKFWEK